MPPEPNEHQNLKRKNIALLLILLALMALVYTITMMKIKSSA